MDLKPCPFCGCPATLVYRGSVTDCSDDEYDIACFTKDCYLCIGADWFMPKDEVTKMWNKRRNDVD